MPKVLVLQLALFGSVTLSTNCWSIWPTFSGSVMALRRALTRAVVDMLLSSQGLDGVAVVAPPWLNPSAITPTKAAPPQPTPALPAPPRRDPGGGGGGGGFFF